MHQANFNQSLERRELKCTRVFYCNPAQIFSLMSTFAILFFAFSLFPQNVSAWGPYDNPSPVDIGSAVDFTVIGKTGIASDNLTTYGGNIGVSPAAAASLADVTCANMTEGRMYTITAPAGPSGCITTASTSVADNAKLSAATADFGAAYSDARNQTTHPFDITSGAVDIGIGVKGRGVYNYTGAVSMDTDLVLRGSNTDIWIFQVNGAKTQAATIDMVLQNEAGVVDGANGPRARNIFWAVDGAPSQGANTHFVGVVMSTGALSVGAGSTYLGRGFSDGTVSAETGDFSTPPEIQEQAPLVTVGQTITAPTIFETPSFAPLSTTGGSGTGGVSFAVTTAGTAGCSIVGTTLSYSSGGTCTVTATKAGNADYLEATSTPATFTINLGIEATAITNQGAGTYTFIVDSGTLNADYYSFRNIDALGLQLIGSPTLTSLNHGDFKQAANGTTLITLASTTLNINAPLAVTNTRFSTGGFSSGVNVSLDATSTNSWFFTGLFGNLWGEAFDIDGINTCGSVRWDDSLCPLTEQTDYRWRYDDGGIGVPDSEWFDTDWNKRQRVRVANNDSTSYTNAVTMVSVTYDSDMQSDFDDLRFTANDGLTKIDFWVERFTSGVSADVWVEVPSLAADSTVSLFMYYDNAIAVSVSSSTATFAAIDDFEDNDLTEYSGDTSIMQTSTNFAYGGSYGLDLGTNQGTRLTNGIARFDQTATSGQTIRYRQNVDTASGGSDESCTLFGVQSPVTDHYNYGVCLELFGTERISIARDVENTDSFGSVVQLASSTLTFVDGWYEVEIDWQLDNTIEVYLYDPSGTLVTTTSVTDTTYSGGGYGFTSWGQNGGWDSFTARTLMTSKPTIFFGMEQSDGGASFAAAQNTPASVFSIGDTARLRIAVENSGLDMIGNQFSIEYSPKGVFLSCAAVTDVSYIPVPLAASCGVSPMCMSTSTTVTNGAVTTDILEVESSTFSSGSFVEDPSNKTSVTNVTQNFYTELEYALTVTHNASDEGYCFRLTDNGDEYESYFNIPEMIMQYAPTLDVFTFNDGQDISLLPGTTTRVYATGTVTDFNGFSDLVLASSTMYRSGVTGGASCSADNNECYISTASNSCQFASCAENSCVLECYSDIYFHADPTDAGSTYGGEEWLAFIEVEDSLGGYGFTSALGVEMLTLRAIDVTGEIDYGSLFVNADTGSFNASTSIENQGNVEVDIEIQGTDLSDGATSVVPASQQKFATSAFTYSACGVSCALLSSTTPVSINVDLAKPIVENPLVSDDVFWGIAIPFGVNSTPHQGMNVFTPIGVP
jgi:hypothetical protein